jgi:hypothetical protein
MQKTAAVADLVGANGQLLMAQQATSVDQLEEMEPAACTLLLLCRAFRAALD